MTDAATLPSIVLVHGAWGDGSAWRGVYDRLVVQGFTVSVAQHSNASLRSDAADVRRVLDRQRGPVILVGHSYGGAVVSEAGDHPAVAALVFVAAFVPDVGESVFGLYPPDGPQPPLEMAADGRTFLNRDAFIHGFAPDIAPEDAAFLADSQVPFSLQEAGLMPLSTATWRAKRSWYLLYTDDQLVPPPMARFMAERAGSTIVEAPGSHGGFIARPQPAADLIVTAARAIVAA